MSNEPFEDYLRVAQAAARGAGEEALRIQRGAAFGARFKADGSPVTEGDKNAELKIIETIKAAYPEHRLYGEEFGRLNEDSGSPYQWVFDPIDGTWAFLNRENTAAVSLALLREGRPLVGVVFNPFTSEMFTVAEGGAAALNGQPLPHNRWPTLGHAVLDYKLGREFMKDIEAMHRLWADYRVSKLIVMGGSLVYRLAMVAKGAHGVCLMGCDVCYPSPWDLTAGVLLIRQAGGRVTDLSGNEIDPLVFSEYIVATTEAHLHEDALRVFEEYGIGRK